MHRGILFTVSGPSGVGKGTICKRVVSEMEEICVSISCTTRLPRVGEEEGREYFFISEERYNEMVVAGQFMEHAGVHGKRYGTPVAYVQKKLDEGIDVILEIDPQGSGQIVKKYPETVSVFIVPPSYQVLKERLVSRCTEKPEQVALRLANARGEMNLAYSYDYALLNNDLECAVERLKDIIRAERMRVKNNHSLIEQVINSFQEGN